MSNKLPDSISIVWYIVDVIDRHASLGGARLSKAQAREILRRIKERHDAAYGVSWDTLDYFTTEFIEELTRPKT